jgi:hypothetical protein
VSTTPRLPNKRKASTNVSGDTFLLGQNNSRPYLMIAASLGASPMTGLQYLMMSMIGRSSSGLPAPGS